MTGWLIYDTAQYRRNSWFAGELISAAAGYGVDLRLIIAESLRFGSAFTYEGKPVSLPDIAVNRTIFPLLSHSLECAGVRVFNSAEISRICNDKRLTYQRFIGTDVPVMPVEFFDRRFLPEELAATAQYPLILKSAAGHGGSEVFMIRDGDELTKTVSGLRDHEFLLQQICPDPGRDLRVYILGGEILGAVLRTAPDSWKSNYSLGGNVEKYSMSPEECRLVSRIMELLGHRLDFAGIDLLLGKDRLWFNEIEDVVGSRMLYKTHGIDVAAMFAEYITSERKLQNV